MKRLICLVLGLLISVSCFNGLAEGEETSFVRIKENGTAEVYAAPGDPAPIDTLDGGWICGLLEETGAAGTVWFRIFYLSSEKKGRTGYINAEDAEKLSQDDLTALMENPDMLNQFLDLIDAVNEYLDEDDTARTGPETNTNSGESQTGSSSLRQFYTNAMEKLQQVFGQLGSADLSAAEDAAKEIGDRLKTAGQDLLDQAKDTVQTAMDDVKEQLEESGLKEQLEGVKEQLEGINLKETLEDMKDQLEDSGLKEKLDDVKNQLEGIDLKETLEDVKEKLDGINVNDKISELKDTLEDKLENSGLNEKLDSLKEKIEELDLNQMITDVRDKLDDSGLKDTVEGVKSTINAMKDEESALRTSLQGVADAFAQLFGNE